MPHTQNLNEGSKTSSIGYDSDLEEIAKIEKRQRDLKRDNRLKYYHPHKKQFQFHNSQALIKAYFGGNRSGKTTAGVVEVAFHTTLRYPDWYPRKGRYSAPTRGRIFATDFKKGVGEVILPKIEEWFPKGTVLHRHRNNMGIYDKYIIKTPYGTTSSFEVCSYEQDPKLLEGWSGDWVLFDEPPPR